MKNIERVRESILASAASLFDRFGYEKTSMDEIARRAHRAKASIYYHFEGKPAIFQAVLEREFRDLTEVLEASKRRYREDSRQQLTAYLTLRMELIRNTKVYRHYVMSPYLYDKDELTEIVSRVRASFDQWEYVYFMEICHQGLELGVFSDKVKPEAFGKMMENLLKGLEIQFLQSENYETFRSTYEAMVEMLIFKSYGTPEENRIGRNSGQE